MPEAKNAYEWGKHLPVDSEAEARKEAKWATMTAEERRDARMASLDAWMPYIIGNAMDA